jgi:DNA repair exonuclease SbcCD ATPase subunit
MAQEQRELNTLEDAVDLLDEWVDHSAQLKLKHDQRCSEMLETMGTAQSLLDEYRAYALELRAELEQANAKLSECSERIAQLKAIARGEKPVPKFADE